MSRFIGIRLDEGLANALDAHARGRGLNRSEAARDLIRRALGVSVDDSGFQEGLNRAKRKANQALSAIEDD